MKLASNIKEIIKTIVPSPVLQIIRAHRQKKHDLLRAKQFSGLSTQDIFEKVYRENQWGNSSDDSQVFFSGSGSRSDDVVDPYVTAVTEFLSSFKEKPNVVDLGCGDFFVGSRIRVFCSSYIACDIVPSLIKFNKSKYKSLGVDFRVLNMSSDKLPPADIVFIRQALQHISNEEIMAVLPKLTASYKHLILTEHRPNLKNLIYNVDIETGPDTRFNKGSCVDVASPPFKFQFKNRKTLCEVPEDQGVLRTEIYQLQ